MLTEAGPVVLAPSTQNPALQDAYVTGQDESSTHGICPLALTLQAAASESAAAAAKRRSGFLDIVIMTAPVGQPRGPPGQAKVEEG
jgi:hypothetical protein